MRRLADMLPAGGRVLEIGSGPGWDADFLEGLGVSVHRTDVTVAFRDFQVERGRRADALDVLTDEIAESYDGILMLAVLQHFERTQLDAVLHKLANAMSGEGALLLSHPVGEGEIWEHTAFGDYRVVRWTSAGLDDRLQRAGFTVTWDLCEDGDEGPWRIALARKRPSDT